MLREPHNYFNKKNKEEECIFDGCVVIMVMKYELISV